MHPVHTKEMGKRGKGWPCKWNQVPWLRAEMGLHRWPPSCHQMGEREMRALEGDEDVALGSGGRKLEVGLGMLQCPATSLCADSETL